MTGKRIWTGAGILFFLLSMFTCAWAVDFPKKPISLIVPYAAGGRTDMIARIFIQYWQKNLGQSVVVVNKPGAGSILGTMEVIKSNPDGYTLVMGSTALLASKYTFPEQVELLRNMAPVGRVDFDPMFLVASQKSGFESLKDMIAFGKKNPKKVKMAAQQGSGMYLYTCAFMKTIGIEPTYIYFQGGGETKVAMAGGHVDLYFDAAYVYEPLVDAQKARFLAVSGEKRQGRHTEVPTLKEQGVSMVWGGWNGVLAPKTTPPDVLQVLEDAMKKTVADKGLLETADKNQISIGYLNRQEFSAFLESEDKNFREIATEIGLYKPKK